ncbi:MAG: hypothetical protein K940chlam9_01284 [Chlamydiae bacterium]|nr:hypothetical protein [Chlamydiota bacterium]
MGRTRSYKDHLKERLKNPKEAAGYLNAALEEDDISIFFLALKDIADAWGGVGKLAEAASLNRQSLYRALAKDGNPRLVSILAILYSLGMEIQIKERGIVQVGRKFIQKLTST